MLLATAVLMAEPAYAAESSDGLPPSSSPFYSTASLYTGEVELGFAWATRKGVDITQWDATGRVAGPLGGWLKGEAEGFWLASTSGGNTVSGPGFVGHLYREEPTHVLGVVGGVTSIDGKTTSAIGVEGKAYFGQNTLTGQIAYLSVKDGKYNYTHFGGQFDHYFTPDFKGAVNVTYFDRQDSSSDFFVATLGVEKRITGTSWSLFGSGVYARTTGTSPADMWGVRVGARVLFDQPGTTLQQHDREVPFNGAWVATMAH